MTTLSDRLHAAADELTATLSPAAEVRRRAERRRRTRAAGTIAAVLAVALMSAGVLSVVVVGDTTRERSTLVPAGPARPENVITDEMEQRARAGTYTPLPQPFLTEQDWDRVTGGLEVLRIDQPVGPLELQAPCDEEPSAAGLRDSRSAQWREPARRARQVETVLTYTDADAASAAVAALLEAFHSCSARLAADHVGGRLPPESSDPSTLSVYAFPHGSVDGGFVIERSSTTVEPGGPSPNVYQLGAALDGNVVVLVESTGWGERTARTLEVALSRALGNQGGRCGPAVRDHRLVTCPVRG